MDINRIVEKLETLGCDAWEVTETETSGWEFYFIRHALDQNRATMVREIRVNVYRRSEDGQFLGKASGEIAPTATEEESGRLLSDLYFQASLVQNPVYRLNDRPVPPELGGPGEAGDAGTAAGEPVDLAVTAERFISAVQSVPESAEADINSYEIFTKEIRRSYRNSNGVAYRCVYPKSQVEVIVNARTADHEIEVFRVFDCGTCDAEKLKRDIQAAMQYGRDRLKAEPTPQTEPLPVVFSTIDSCELYAYFRDRMLAQLKYRQMSDWEIGRPVCEEFRGDRVSLEALPFLPNSSGNYPVDEEGAVIRQRFLLRDGVPEEFWGSRQFSQYLGLADSSLVNNLRVSGGSKTAQEIRSGDYLEVVEFSDFQVDELSGDFAGEIRLGYLHQGAETKIVTGGSISGDMREAVKTMTFSEETVQYDNFAVPAVTRLEGVRVTGAK